MKHGQHEWGTISRNLTGSALTTMLSRRVLLLVPAAVLTGCGAPASDPASPGAPPTPTGGPGAGTAGATPASGTGASFTVGLITNGSLADSGWNSLAGAGLKQMESELGAKTSHQSSSA
ncbi:MAG: hypothetical protein FJX77_06850, partial [Armatimonadetes bacterium]|nr:hypothetical protein [Armatimonadota bacterium]